MAKKISELTDLEFAKLFNAALTTIRENPLDNFIKARGFLNFYPTFAQSVIFKVILNLKLDAETTKEVHYEKLDAKGGYSGIEKKLLTEVELYERLTNTPYVYPHPVKNRINFIAGRRCLAADTLVMTPSGPVPIKELKQNDTVYSENGEEIKVVAVIPQGIQETVSIMVNGKEICRATDNHRFVVDLKANTTLPVCRRVRFLEGNFDLMQKRVIFEPGKLKLMKSQPLKVKLGERRKEDTYDITVSSGNNLYLLANGLISHNSGKSLLSAIISLLCAVTTNWKPFLTKTPYATVLVLSHSKEFSEEILDLIRKFIEESEILTRLLDNTEHKKDRKTAFSLRVPFIVNNQLEYSNVMIRVGAASKKTVRGKAVCVLLCDEIAYWNLSEKAADRDIDILSAARPGLAQFKDKGLLIKLSSPGIKQGILYEEYENKAILPDNYVIFKAPTWVWNPLLNTETYEEQYKTDPTGFMSEFRSEFVDAISDFFSMDYVDFCIAKNKKFQPPDHNKEDVIYSASIDAAFKSDRFAFTIVGTIRGKVKQYVLKVWKGTPTMPVKAFDVAQEIAQICRNYDIGTIKADQFAFQPLAEIFQKFGLVLEEQTFTNTFKHKIFFNLRKLIHSKQIDILDQPELINEIKQLQIEETNTGTKKISHKVGGHDDQVSALAVAAFNASQNYERINIGNKEEIFTGNDYNIVTDLNTGRAVQAPSPNMLHGFWGDDYVDNSWEYEIDKKTGELKKITDGNDDEGGDEGGGTKFFF